MGSIIRAGAPLSGVAGAANDISDTLQNWLATVGNAALKCIVFLIIFFVGWLIARAVDSAVSRLLAKVGFDRLAERTGLRRWTGRYAPSALVGRIVRYIILLITLQLAFGVFGPNAISDLIDAIIAWIPRLIVACVILVVAIAIAGAVFDIIRNALSQFSYGKGLGRAAQIAIIVLGAIAALNQIGVATTVTMPVLVTILATIGGILIVGVGGGLIQPMRERWERMLTKGEAEMTKVSTHLKGEPPAPGADATRPLPPTT
ncbi:hypothetical protein AB0H43_29415 [Hamadaea sp. NPDC050747]|uniref:mechanosensitive ion channel family protein n=1 Tax=Hamadaea sp. NPDC050747 TaxID=3155789 RepID=UPI003409ACA6